MDSNTYSTESEPPYKYGEGYVEIYRQDPQIVNNAINRFFKRNPHKTKSQRRVHTFHQSGTKKREFRQRPQI